MFTATKAPKRIIVSMSEIKWEGVVDLKRLVSVKMPSIVITPSIVKGLIQYKLLHIMETSNIVVASYTIQVLNSVRKSTLPCSPVQIMYNSSICKQIIRICE